MTEPLAPASAGRVEFAPWKTLWLYLSLAAATLVVFYPPDLQVAAVSAGLGLLTLCVGHSVGLHRGIIHRTYQSSPFVRGLFAYCFVHTGLGGPLAWVRLHYVRDHYQNARACPRYFGYAHSLWRDYYWSLHLRFVPRDDAVYGIPPELLRDGWLRFLERTWYLHVLALAAVIALTFGVEAAVTCVGVRVFASIIGHWLIGFMAHKRGYVRYELDGSPEIGRNLLLLGALSFGEGFHNNHHANPGSARMGEAWYELDLGWYALLLLERLGLVRDVRATGRSRGVSKATARPVPLTWRSGHSR